MDILPGFSKMVSGVNLTDAAFIHAGFSGAARKNMRGRK